MALAAAQTSCAHDKATSPPPPCTTPEPFRVSVTASARLNPGEKGEALATVVRIYELKGTSKLTGGSFDDLLDHDKDTLGDELLSTHELTINPGERADPSWPRNPDATHLAAVALFRQPAGTNWRAFKRLPAPDPEHCHRAGGGAQGAAARPTDNVRFFLDENRIELR